MRNYRGKLAVKFDCSSTRMLLEEARAELVLLSSLFLDKDPCHTILQSSAVFLLGFSFFLILTSGIRGGIHDLS